MNQLHSYPHRWYKTPRIPLLSIHVTGHLMLSAGSIVVGPQTWHLSFFNVRVTDRA